MILTGHQITHEVANGRIIIDPFDQTCVNPNSYNFHLDERLFVYTDEVIDPRKELALREIIIPVDGLILTPGQMYLGSTVEVMGSEHFVPTYAARSSIARLGMFINFSAPLGDIGFIGQWTLQLLARNRIRIYPRMRIGQMMFWLPKGLIELYQGKYQHARGPMASKVHCDFKETSVQYEYV